MLDDGETSFKKNKYNWNKEATVIYIESPAGVGFSTCLKSEECRFDDNNSAEDNLGAVLNLMLYKFPDLQDNDLYIAGESYAGIYIPYLVEKIDEYNEYHKSRKGVYLPKLKGFMIGNGVTHWKYDTTPAFVEMAFLHGLIDPKLYLNIKSKCDLEYLAFKQWSLSYEC